MFGWVLSGLEETEILRIFMLSSRSEGVAGQLPHWLSNGVANFSRRGVNVRENDCTRSPHLPEVGNKWFMLYSTSSVRDPSSPSLVRDIALHPPASRKITKPYPFDALLLDLHNYLGVNCYKPARVHACVTYEGRWIEAKTSILGGRGVRLSTF